MNTLRLFGIGFSTLILASCTVMGPDEGFRQPTGSGSSVSSQSGGLVYDPNEAMPENTDSLEPGLPTSSVPIEIHATTGSILMGSVEATVLTIIDDYGCFYCREFGSTDLPWLLSSYVPAKKLTIERVFFPQSPAGTLMAKAAICSAKQNMFEKTDAYLHATPIATDTQVAVLAKAVGLNLKTLQTCIASKETTTTLNYSVQRAKLSTDRVPFFIFDNDSWLGVMTRDDLKAKIDAAL